MKFSHNIEILQSRTTNYSMKIFEHERKQSELFWNYNCFVWVSLHVVQAWIGLEPLCGFQCTLVVCLGALVFQGINGRVDES